MGILIDKYLYHHFLKQPEIYIMPKIIGILIIQIIKISYRYFPVRILYNPT